MRPCRVILSLGAFTVFVGFATSIDAKDGKAAKKKPITAAECERLVKQLVNPHKAPFTEIYVDRLPKGLNVGTLQAKARAAYNELSKNFKVALPVLVKNVHDQRFSYVYEDRVTGVYLKATVGQACDAIIGAHVEVYRRHVTTYDGEGRPRSLWFISACGGIDNWWESRKGKTLAELQLEGIEWALRQKKPRHFKSDKKWAAAKQSLEKMAKEIRETKKPIKVKHEVQFFSR
jgi:hypothetical protein